MDFFDIIQNTFSTRFRQLFKKLPTFKFFSDSVCHSKI